MKITIYELLGLVKDGKAPKKIKYDGTIYQYSEYNGFYYCNGFSLYREFVQHGNCLNNEVEIIEENKKIEKITVREKTLGFPNGEWTARNMDKAFAIKINGLIDEINSLKEND